MTSDSPATASTPGTSRPTRVLVTGASGEVGHGLINALGSRSDHDVIALDLRRPDPSVTAYCDDVVVGDLLDDSNLDHAWKGGDFDVVFHLAAMLSTSAEKQPERALDVNLRGTTRLLDRCASQFKRTGNAAIFVLPSSIAAYGVPNGVTTDTPVGEDQYLQPITMYGCTKLACEHIGRYYARHFQQLEHGGSCAVDFRCVRYPGLISADTVPTGGTSDFGPEMIHAAAAGRPYECFVGPDARIPFMTMPDAIAATLALAAAPRSALSRTVYNIGAFAPTAAEFAAAVEAIFPGSDVTFVPQPHRANIVESWPNDVDVSAAAADWGFAPQYDFEGAIAFLAGAIRSRQSLSGATS